MATRKTSRKSQGTRPSASQLKRKPCGHYTCGPQCQVMAGNHRLAGERGQGISLNTIIIAVLGLIVLVVLIVIFTGQTGKFTKGTGETMTIICAGRWAETCDPSTEQPFYGVTDAAQLRANINKICCVQKT